MSDVDFSDCEEDAAAHKRHARAQHNALERRRRDNIKDMYGALKNAIPTMRNERASRAAVLKKAIDLITTKQNDLEKILAENRQLEQENEILEREIEILQQKAGKKIQETVLDNGNARNNEEGTESESKLPNDLPQMNSYFIHSNRKRPAPVDEQFIILRNT